MSDDELIEAMWRAYSLHATPRPFNVREAMAAELAAARAEIDAMRGEPHADRCAQSKRLRAQCEALQAELEALRAEHERLKGDYSEEAVHLRTRAVRAEAEVARLRAALKNAPHDEHCTYRSPHTPADDCDCWKAAALKET